LARGTLHLLPSFVSLISECEGREPKEALTFWTHLVPAIAQGIERDSVAPATPTIDASAPYRI
jgi:hypothetical protein